MTVMMMATTTTTTMTMMVMMNLALMLKTDECGNDNEDDYVHDGTEDDNDDVND